MKKIFLLSILLFQLTFSYAQSEWSEYGSWASDGCFPQIMWRIKVVSNPKINTTSVMAEFKNNYARKVNFMFAGFNNSAEAKQVFSEKGNLMGGQQSSISLGSGQSSTYTFSIKGAGANRATIEIYTLYFDNDYQHYQKCNDGSMCMYCQVNGYNEPACPNYSNKENNSSTNSGNQNTQPTTTSNSSTVQTNKTHPNQTQSNQVINTIPNNTNTEILNVLESTGNQITNTLTNSIEKSKGVLQNNELEIKNTRKEFQENNLSDKEIDSLLANPDPNNYSTINIYEEIKCCRWYILINGKNLPIMDRKNKKIEYRVYSSNKLLIQYYAAAGLGTTPMKSFMTNIRKGKTYHFIIKRLSMTDAAIEQIDEEPVDKKGNKIYENINLKIKSDID